MNLKTRRRWLKAGIVVGALLTSSPFVGLLGTASGTIKAFQTLGASGIGDPSTLAGAVGEVLVSTVAGLLVMPFGLALLIPCVVTLRRLDRSTLPPPLPPPS